MLSWGLPGACLVLCGPLTPIYKLCHKPLDSNIASLPTLSTCSEQSPPFVRFSLVSFVRSARADEWPRPTLPRLTFGAVSITFERASFCCNSQQCDHLPTELDGIFSTRLTPACPIVGPARSLLFVFRFSKPHVHLGPAHNLRFLCSGLPYDHHVLRPGIARKDSEY